MDFFVHSRPQVTASAVGIPRAAFEYATDYANGRRAFGKPLLAKQGVSFKLAHMAIRSGGGAAARRRAAAAVDAGEDAGLHGSPRRRSRRARRCRSPPTPLQILGGVGIRRDHPVEKWMRDAKVLQIVEGTSEIQRHVIVQHLRR